MFEPDEKTRSPNLSTRVQRSCGEKISKPFFFIVEPGFQEQPEAIR